MAVALWYLALTQGAGVSWTRYVFQRMLVAICTSCERKAACLAVSSLCGLRVVVLCSGGVGAPGSTRWQVSANHSAEVQPGIACWQVTAWAARDQ